MEALLSPNQAANVESPNHIDGTNAQDDDNDDENELLDWDDEDFELAEIDDHMLNKISTTDAKKDENKSDANDNDHDNDDEWLRPIHNNILEPSHVVGTGNTASGHDGVPKAPRHNESAPPHGDVYLTDQFKRLSTPSSKKKSRCVICTRPVPEGKFALYCEKHWNEANNNVGKWNHRQNGTNAKKRVSFSDQVEVICCADDYEEEEEEEEEEDLNPTTNMLVTMHIRERERYNTT